MTEKATRRRLGFALQPRFTNTWTVPAPSRGSAIEFGLGNGRIYDHLRLLFPEIG